MTEMKLEYNTNLAKGTGFVNETLELLSLVEENDTKTMFLKRCLEQNPLSKSTEKRTRDVVSLVFFDRYWNGELPKHLHNIRENGLGLEGMKSLFLVYTSRANGILRDFILEYFSKDKKVISTVDSARFIDGAISEGIAPVWSESMRKRVASYLISCCKDFNLIDNKGAFQYYVPETFVVNYFLHELHFSGLNDNQILEDSTWGLLQLDTHNLIREIENISYKGSFIMQYSGEILHISWKYQNMNEFIEHECRY